MSEKKENGRRKIDFANMTSTGKVILGMAMVFVFLVVIVVVIGLIQGTLNPLKALVTIAGAFSGLMTGFFVKLRQGVE